MYPNRTSQNRSSGTRRRKARTVSDMNPQTPEQLNRVFGNLKFGLINSGAAKERKFDGKRFSMSFATGGKNNAKYRARQLRAAGYNARVVEWDGFYAVYSRRR